MRLRSATKVPGVPKTLSGPPLKRSTVPTLDNMPIVVLDSLIERLDAKSLIYLKNTNRKFARAVRSNRCRLWRRFWSLLREISQFMSAVCKFQLKIIPLGQSLLQEGHESESDIIFFNGIIPIGKIYDEVIEERLLKVYGPKRLRNSWKKDAEKFSEMRKKLIAIDNTLESLQLQLSLPESEEVKKEINCFKQKVLPLKAKAAQCQKFCVLLSSYFR